MSDKHRKPHPHSPAGGGGPGGFRHAGSLGVDKYHWAGLNDRRDTSLLNVRVPSELTSHTAWNSDASTDPPPQHKVGDKIIILYDLETSKGRLYVVGRVGHKKKIVLEGNVVVGSHDHVTPTGDFHAFFWEINHVSKLYGWQADTPWNQSALGLNAFGPYQLHIRELEHRGIYIHGTMGPSWSHTTAISGVAVSTSSHGCIRMCNADIIELHSLIPNPKGMPIRITTKPDDAPKE